MAPNKTERKPKPAGLPRSQRIRRRADFARLRKNSQKWVARHWILFIANNEVGQPRLALTISGKYGNAVARNWYRRWLREAFRLHKAVLPPRDLHFIARQKPANLSKKSYKDELNEDFERLLHRYR